MKNIGEECFYRSKLLSFLGALLTIFLCVALIGPIAAEYSDNDLLLIGILAVAGLVIFFLIHKSLKPFVVITPGDICINHFEEQVVMKWSDINNIRAVVTYRGIDLKNDAFGRVVGTLVLLFDLKYPRIRELSLWQKIIKSMRAHSSGLPFSNLSAKDRIRLVETIKKYYPKPIEGL